MDFTNDAMGCLARWAWEGDMDEAEREAAGAARAAQGRLRAQRLAWQPVALWGPGKSVAGLRKLRRAAMARMDARDLCAELGWEAVGHGAEMLARLRAASAALCALSEPCRVGALWGMSREAGARRAVPLESQAAFARAMEQPWGSRAWQSAAWGAMAGMDWDEKLDGWMAARALSLAERGELEEESGSGSGSVRRV